MISEFFLGLWQNVVSWFLGLLPNMTDAAGMVVTARNWISSMIASGSALGVWIPWDVIAVALPLTLTIYIAIFVLKIVKNLWAMVPAIGGAG